jgi:hypothetical protein
MGVAIAVGLTPAPSEVRAAVAAESKNLSVCIDADGKPLAGAIDVVLLLDNSRSLNSEKATPTDPKNMRYDAVRELLVSLGSVGEGGEEQKEADINFGMITFGASAVERIPLTRLTSANAGDLADEVREKSPTARQEQVTNYVVALKKALEVLNSRPAGNCKFLVWFTDGQFERNEIPIRDPERNKKISSQADYLKREVCKAGGLADQFQQLRINTFVLVLRPTRTDNRLGASYGAMQAITGATNVPAAVGQNSSGDICGNLSGREHLGEIYDAERATDIARLVPVVTKPISGWTPATACPVSSDDEDMPLMPASRHLSRLSFTAYTSGKELSSLENSRIVDPGGEEHTFSEYLEEITSSRFERQYRFNKKAWDDLLQGWTFSIEGGEAGWCVNLYHHRFEVSFTDKDSEPVRQVSKGGRLSAEDLRSLTYRNEAGENLTLSQARSETSQVNAFLDIDPTGKLFEEPIPVAVKQLNTPSIGCEKIELRDTSGRDLPKERTLAQGCEIDTSFSAVRGLTATLTVSELLSEGKCNGTVGLVESDDEIVTDRDTPVTSRVEHPDKSQKVLYVVFRANGRSASCNAPTGTSLLIEFDSKSGGKPVEVPILIEVEWKRVPIWWVVLLVALASLVAVALINLAVLGQLTRRTTKLPASGQVMAYEVPVRVEKVGASQVRVSAEDGTDLGSHVFAVSRLISLTPNAARSEVALRDGSRATLRIVYPPLFRPFRPPYLVIDPANSPYYWQKVSRGDGLSPMTRSGVIVHSPRRQDNYTMALVTFLVPSTGNREELVRSLLTSRVQNALARSLSDPAWFGERQVDGIGGPSAANPPSAPPVTSQPPNPPLPPNPPQVPPGGNERPTAPGNGNSGPRTDGPPRPGGPPRPS